MDTDVKCTLDIYEMGNCGNEPMRECVNRNFFLLQHFHVDVKECPLQWWNKHKTMFPIVGLLT
jgi:hypothetical protein